MAYIIFEVKSENAGNINKLVKDDIVSRQTVISRDASSLDLKGDTTFVKVEGSPEGLDRAMELSKDLNMKKLDEKKAEKINKLIEEQEDSAASGMGMIFD